MTAILGYHSSGEWDQPLPLWAASMQRLEKIPGMSYGSHTEATRDQTESVFKRSDWDYFRSDDAAAQIILRWDPTVWEFLSSYTYELSGIRVRTEKGFLQPPTWAAGVQLRHREARRRFILEGGHWPLRNTPLRAKAWAESADSLVEHTKDLERQHPRAGFAHNADFNESIRPGAEAERARILQLCRRLDMAQAWDLDDLGRGGTHGPIALIDNQITNLRLLPCRPDADDQQREPRGAFLLPDDKSSDHRPFAIRSDLPAKGQKLPR